MPNTTRRRLQAAGLAMSSHERAALARTPGTLRFALSRFPPNSAPWDNTGTAALGVTYQIYRGLLSYDAKGSLRGELAASRKSDGVHAGDRGQSAAEAAARQRQGRAEFDLAKRRAIHAKFGVQKLPGALNFTSRLTFDEIAVG